ncbi:MAG: hypothetical protein O3A13_07720 [Proteobacteria bacterium]|nr:hypothetical protein [Pseudomonadota bacterium]MDA0993508.1 hypothetical protein [Pseudomonadota bacterium]
MNSAKLNDWLGVVANLGIVVGLVIVYLELDHANRLAEANAVQFRDSEISNARKEYADSELLPGIVVKARNGGFDSLTEVEFERYRSWELGRLRRLMSQYRQYERGFLGQEIIDGNINAAIEGGWLEVWDELDIQHIDGPDYQDWLALIKANQAVRKDP